MLVAADGLRSSLRRSEGLDAPCSGPRRFGLRRHFGLPPWSSSLEIHLANGAEAYVTPVSNCTVGVAFLWTEPRDPNQAFRSTSGFPSRWQRRWDWLAGKFPRLMDRLAGSSPQSSIRGAGPFEQASRARIADRFALVGDAAGYVDAITGEGISLSLMSACALAGTLPDALAKGAHREALVPYELESRRLFRRYELMTRSLLGVIRRPRLRRSLFGLFQEAPALFDLLLAKVVG
jgi:2-polyprenyl-6-methoxyphenol hydroxylase-like FAD-dependent oxidoreductase